MLTPTHALTASTLYLAFGGTSPVAGAVAIGTALIPDLDTRQSLAGRALPFIAGPIEHHFGHRTITHSLLFQLVICSLAYALLPAQFALAITCGLVSHAFADMLTKSGVCWFWPSRVRCVFPGSPKYRFEVGGWGELVFACVMAAASFGFVWLHQSTAGTAGVIRSAIGDIGAARQQYDEQKGSQAFTLRLTGRDNSSFEAIEGEYPVIAAWAGSGLLVRANGEPKTVCKSEGCAWYPEHAVLVSTGEQQTTVRTIEAKSITAEALREQLAHLSQYGEVLISGKVRAKLEPNGTTVQRVGQGATLYYAGIENFPATGRLRGVELTVQVRHAAGHIPQKFVPAGQSRDSLPNVSEGLLERWLD